MKFEKCSVGFAGDYGDLMDYATGDYIRPATKDERTASDDAVANGHAEGCIPVDWRGEGGWNGEDYRICWVQP